MKIRSIVIDNETTGLTLPAKADLSKQPHIIEFAGALLEGSKIVERFETLIYPGMEVSAEITKITGITNDALRGKPTFSEVEPQISAILNKADVLIAHNAPFDTSCLRYEYLRLGRTVTPQSGPLPSQIICTVQEYIHEFGRRPRLIELYEKKVGRPLAQTHRAMDDVDALIEALKADRFFEAL